MSYRINTVEYYQRFIDLQEKLRKSEEERLKLEIRLNKMMQIIQTEEQRHYDNLSMQYKQFQEDDKKRQDRNNYILRILDRVENQSEALEEKARRLSMIRDQYYGMPRRHYEERPNYLNQQSYENESNNLSPERDMYSAIDMKEYNMNKNFNLQHQEKMRYLNKYLETIDSNKNNDKSTFNKSPRTFRSLSSPTPNKSSNLKLEDLKPTTPELGYKAENFLTNRYSYQNFDDDEDVTSSPNESTRYVPTCRNRSKSPNFLTNDKLDDVTDHNVETYFSPNFDCYSRLSRYPRKLDRKKKQTPKKLFSTDYKNSLEKLQRIQENSRKILSQHIPKTNYYSNQNIDYDRRPILPYQNDLFWNYPVASDFGLNINDMYHPDKVIQKYLIEKYNPYLSDRYPPIPFDSYHDRMMHVHFPPRAYHRHDYNRNLPDRYESTSNIPNDYYTYPKSPRNYEGTHPVNSEFPRFNKLDEHYSKLPKSNYISGSDNAHNKNDDLRKDERTQGIHFNDNDEILEYDRNKPSSEYNKKYELKKNWKDNDISLNTNENKYNSNSHEELNCIQDGKNDKDTNSSLNKSTLPNKYPFHSENKSPLNENTVASEGYVNTLNEERNNNNINYNHKNIENSSIASHDMESSQNHYNKDNEHQYEAEQNKNPLKQNNIQKEEISKPSVVEELGDTYNGVESNVVNSSQNENIKQPNRDITSDNPEEIKSPLNENIAVVKQANEVSASDQVYKENKEQTQNLESDTSNKECDESQMYDANSEPIQYDTEQAVRFDKDEQPNQYVQNGDIIQYENDQPIPRNEDQPIQYDQDNQKNQYNNNGQPNEYGLNDQPIQYDENGQPLQYDANGQVIQYDENGQAIQFDQNIQPIQYDENGQPIQYDANGQSIQFDQNGQPIQYDENGQPLQYDTNGQVIQYDENGQTIQFDQNIPPIQYNENGESIQYDENGQPIQFDPNGQPIQYDENGQPIQYDENGQAIQYDENGQPIQYDENGQPIQYDENGQLLQHDALNQSLHYPDGQQPHYDSNGQQIQYDESGKPIEYTEVPNLENNYKQVDDVANSKNNAAELTTDDANKPNVFEMLDTDTESIKQDTKISNDSDFELTT